ncbi:hypothetical protein [Aureivirga marina]|uniref:hypothetical protein n=1 Tax=Aureivirga marina TaxID=1182451 RepID=UPI0018CB9BF6|nr:hypothetical protein [Aureivirga marina]
MKKIKLFVLLIVTAFVTLTSCKKENKKKNLYLSLQSKEVLRYRIATGLKTKDGDRVTAKTYLKIENQGIENDSLFNLNFDVEKLTYKSKFSKDISGNEKKESDHLLINDFINYLEKNKEKKTNKTIRYTKKGKVLDRNSNAFLPLEILNLKHFQIVFPEKRIDLKESWIVTDKLEYGEVVSKYTLEEITNDAFYIDMVREVKLNAKDKLFSEKEFKVEGVYVLDRLDRTILQGAVRYELDSLCDITLNIAEIKK